MKILGKKFDVPNEDFVVFPRKDNEIVFHLRAVQNYEPFEKLCKVPEPPEVLLPGNQKGHNVDDPKYHAKLKDFAEKKTHWLVLKTLEPTQGLEWETIKMDDPETWGNYEDELRESCFSDTEIIYLIRKISQVNALSEATLEAARERFLAERSAAQDKSTGQKAGPITTQSGEPAKE